MSKTNSTVAFELAERIRQREEDYQALSRALANESDPVRRNEYDRRLKSMESELAALNQRHDVMAFPKAAFAIPPELANHFPDLNHLRDISRRSAGGGLLPEPPANPTVADYLHWLGELGQLANGRHPLYDVLAEAGGRPDLAAPARQAIRALQDALTATFPSLVTTRLAPPPDTDEPAVIEIIFESPVASSSGKQPDAYPVRSRWHRPGGGAGSNPMTEEPPQLAPNRADDTAQYVARLLEALDDWEHGCCKEILFLFRIPFDLAAHIFEDWPVDSGGGTLGQDFPVALAPRHREKGHYRRWKMVWARLQEISELALKDAFQSYEQAGWPEDSRPLCVCVDLGHCTVLYRVPTADLLFKLVEKGACAVMWPRTPQAEAGVPRLLHEDLGNTRYGRLPITLRDRRKHQPDDATVRGLGLMWDDPRWGPSRQFHPGLE